MSNLEICQLHKENSTLLESHIIPKFVFNWMKKTGTGRIRKMGTFQIPLQDGAKSYMLCANCENLFSKYEKWFNENVFKSYLADNNFIITENENLTKFSISILWRVLKHFIEDKSVYHFINELRKAEKEWSDYLLKDTQLVSFKNIHLVLVDNSYFFDIKSDLYFSRSVDYDIGQSEKECVVYAKFSRFILFGEIAGFKQSSFKNTNLTTEANFKNTNQVIPSSIIQFLHSRVERIKLFKDLSPEQQIKNNKKYESNLDEIMKSDLGQVLKKYKK